MFYKTFAFVALLFFALGLGAQDLHYSQTDFQTQAAVGPASTGLFDGHYRGQAIARQQWQSVPVPYTTIGVQGDLRRNLSAKSRKRAPAFWGLGIAAANDIAGDSRLSTTTLNLSAAYHQPLGKYLHLSAGAAAGFVQRRVNLNNLSFDRQFNGDLYDPQAANGESGVFGQTGSVIRPDMAAALGLRYERSHRTYWQIHAAAFHLLRPKLNFAANAQTSLSQRFSITLDASLAIASRFDVQVQSGLQFQQPYRQVLNTLLFRYHIKDYTALRSSIFAGVAYRLGDAVIPRVGFRHQQWTFGFAYDINLSRFEEATNGRGGFEFALQYILKRVEPLPNVEECPVF